MTVSAARGPARLGRNFTYLWTASAFSNLADGAFKVALPLVAVRWTDSPMLIAGLTVALTLPWLLFALPAGALADRLDRRRSMVVANTVRAVLVAALTLLVAVGGESTWVLYAVAFALGTAETLHDTSAQSILPQLVPRAALPRANGRLHAAELTANQFAGPPLGGALVAVSLLAAFAAPAVLWAAGVGALLLLRGSFRLERPERTTLRSDLAEGLRFLGGHRVLRTLAMMVGGFNLAGNAAWAVMVLYAVGPGSPMGLTDPQFGLLLGVTATGSLLGALTAERVERRLGRARSLALTTLGSAAMVGLPAVTANVAAVGAGFFVGGAAIAVWNVVTVSLRQQVTPDALLGRVNSGYRLVAWGTMPLGAALGGLLAETAGLRVVFAVAAVVSLALLAGLLVVTDAAMDAAGREAMP